MKAVDGVDNDLRTLNVRVVNIFCDRQRRPKKSAEPLTASHSEPLISHREPLLEKKKRATNPGSSLIGQGPRHLQEREANADRSQVYHSVRENLMSGSSQVPKSTGRPVAWFSSKTGRIKKLFPKGMIFSLRHQQVLGNNEPLCRFSNPETSVKSIHEGHRDHVLAEAKSEFLKQECKVDSLNTCIRELQRQAHSNRLELGDVKCGMKNP